MRKSLIIAGLLAVAVAGCGSSNDNTAQDYAVRVQRAQFQFADGFEKATTSLLKSTDPHHDAIALRQAASAVDTDVKALRAIPPPQKVAGLHRQLVAIMSGYGGQLRRAAHLIGGGGANGFVPARRLLTRSSTTVKNRFNSIIAKINQQLS